MINDFVALLYTALKKKRTIDGFWQAAQNFTSR